MIHFGYSKLKNSTCFYFLILNKGVFVKNLSLDLYKREVAGYKFLTPYFKTAYLIINISLLNRGYIFYRYLPIIKNNKGLLIDELVEVDKKLPECTKLIFRMYKNAFEKSARYTKPTSEKLFIHNRIDSRLLNWYGADGKNIASYSKLVSEIFEKAKNLRDNDVNNCYCVASQCDPSDMNLTVDGYLLDYSGGGYVSIEAELASFLTINILHAELLGPKYHSKAYKDHNFVFKHLDTVEKVGSSVRHNVSVIRFLYIKEYFDNVFFPTVISEINSVTYERFKICFAIRTLTVFNLTEIDTMDAQVIFFWIDQIWEQDNFKSLYNLLKQYDHFK